MSSRFGSLWGKQGGPPETPSPLFDKPWREINWGGKQETLDYVNNYRPYKEDQQIRILLHGLGGAGKSSFINSVQSVLRGRMCVGALADNTSGDSFTTQFKTYKIQRGGPDTFYPIIFSDIMGLSSDKGVHVEDVKLALMGHVKDEYKFNPVSKLSDDDPFYNNNPTDNDKVHVLVCVVPTDTLPTMSNGVKEKIRDIRLDATRLDIPQVAVLTKVDLGCPEVNSDLKNVYRSKRMKEMMEQFSADVGIPMNCIFPVKNYHEETDLSDEVDSLILNALKHIINHGDDFINKKLQTN